MELHTVRTGKKQVVVAPLGDVQWTGPEGAAAERLLRRHIELALARDAYFLGLGDMIDFLSPSNRQRLRSAALYDTADAVIDAKAHALVEELYERVLKPTRGRWLGMLEGHHFYEAQGSTSDMWLAELLETSFLGTSAYIRLLPADVVLWAHHGVGNSVLPSGPLNKLYHVAHGFAGADVFVMGHTTRMGAVRLSRPEPDWARGELRHRDILLVNAGGFAKSSVVGHRMGRIVRGDYAEQKMLSPSPLAAPLIVIDGAAKNPAERIRVEL
jgi:hypothetical protein